MNLVLRLISRYALWIYVLCALLMILYLRAALAARREGSQALFSLEREAFARRIYRSSGMIVLLLAIVIGVYALSHYVDLPEPEQSPIILPTPADEEATPTRPDATLTPEAETTTAAPTATQPRATRSAAPTAPPATPTPPAAAASCPHPNVYLLQPGQNQVIDEGIQVRGTANKDSFDRYEFKFQSRDIEDEWHWVETFYTPVENGDLGWWPTSHLPDGNYRFMLIAIDKNGNSQECVVPVVINH